MYLHCAFEFYLIAFHSLAAIIVRTVTNLIYDNTDLAPLSLIL